MWLAKPTTRTLRTWTDGSCSCWPWVFATLFVAGFTKVIRVN